MSKLSAEWLEHEHAQLQAHDCDAKLAAAVRIAALALRYAAAVREYADAMLRHDPCDADPPRHSPCSCSHCLDYKALWPPMNRTKDALLAACRDVTP